MHIRFRGCASVNFGVVVNECQILALLRGVGFLNVLPRILLRLCAVCILIAL
jgi:hypothetical protein